MMTMDDMAGLFKGSPFLPKAPCPGVEGLRRELREIGRAGDCDVMRDWGTARLVMADALDEQASDERWFARLPLEKSRSSRCGNGHVVYWTVAVPAGIARPFCGVAVSLGSAQNSRPVLGWMPGELKLTQVRFPSVQDRDGLLTFTSMERRHIINRADALAAPGGFLGLAWLYWKLIDEANERRAA